MRKVALFSPVELQDPSTFRGSASRIETLNQKLPQLESRKKEIQEEIGLVQWELQRMWRSLRDDNPVTLKAISSHERCISELQELIKKLDAQIEEVKRAIAVLGDSSQLHTFSELNGAVELACRIMR